MMAKAVLLVCAQALMIQSIAGQYIGSRTVANSAYGPGTASASHGGALPTSSASAIPPSGVSIVSENAYEGPLSVSGALPFLGTVALEGALPTYGSGAVAYGCGNGEVAMLSEDIGGAASPLAGPFSYANDALASRAGALAYDQALAGQAYGSRLASAALSAPLANAASYATSAALAAAPFAASAPLAGPFAGPLSGPFAGSLAGPLAAPLAGPLSGPLGGPLAGPFAGPLAGPLAGPYVGPLAGPAAADASNGGALPVTSASSIAPNGVSLASENAYEGPLSVAGALPFLGTVALEGALPTAGMGAVAYGCGNGEVAMLSEDFGGAGAGPYGYAGNALGYRAGAGPLARSGCGCGARF